MASDLWSLGLSLLEISLGMYPIPPPDQETLMNIFGPQIADDPQTAHQNLMNSGKPRPQPKPMAIFELLEHIVNQPPPKLPPKVFSENMRDFVDRCLKRNANERPDLASLMVIAPFRTFSFCSTAFFYCSNIHGSKELRRTTSILRNGFQGYPKCRPRNNTLANISVR